jgi:hypothetical protein
MTSCPFVVQVYLVLGTVAASGPSSPASEQVASPLSFVEVQVGASMISVRSKYPTARRHEVKEDLEVIEGCDRTAGILIRIVGAPHADGNVISVSANRVRRGYCGKKGLPRLAVSPVLRGSGPTSITLESAPADIVRAYGQVRRTTTKGNSSLLSYDAAPSQKGIATSLSFSCEGDRIASISIFAAPPNPDQGPHAVPTR